MFTRSQNLVSRLTGAAAGLLTAGALVFATPVWGQTPCELNPVIEQDGPFLNVTKEFDSYQWYRNGQPIDGATEQEYEIQRSGEYTVAVTRRSEPFRLPVSIEDRAQLSDDQLRIFPNPAESQLTLRLADVPSGTWQVRVVDLMGQSLESRQIETHGHDLELNWNLPQLEAGMYFFELEGPEGLHVTRRVMMK